MRSWLLFATFLVLLLGSTRGIKFKDSSNDEHQDEVIYDTNLSNADERFDFDLGGSWKLVNANGSVSLNGNVPGNVHTDLWSAGMIGDPYYRFNDVVYRWIGLDRWTYTRTFTLDSNILSKKKIMLWCEGIDTIATIKINGKLVGSTENMFRRYSFDITSLLTSGSNSISISFTDAPSYVNEKNATYPYPVPVFDSPVASGLPNRNFIRKEQCSFSWDWGPAFVPQGIWQPIGIVAYDVAKILYVVPEITPVDDLRSFNVKTTVTVSAVAADTDLKVVATISGLTSTSKIFTVPKGTSQVEVSLDVKNVKLWWPRGYGDPNLYNLQVDILSQNVKIDTIHQTIGFRKVRVVTDPIEGQTGATFYFEVNNVAIFAKGSNWIPADSFENRVTRDVLEDLLTSAAEANMNIVRNWGGGIYQHDAFYDICDRLGLMVWQEFMFACSMYPRDQSFIDNVAEEVRHQISRLSHHSSIILWSGNNENEVALGWSDYVKTYRDRYLVDYVELYYDTVRTSLLEVDKSRPFWPSSPSNGPLSEDPYVGIWGDGGSSSWGDVHYYNYIWDCKNLSKLSGPRFASEYGFQSMDSYDTWQPVTQVSDLTRNSTLMVHRQHHPNGNGEMEVFVQRHFRLPKETGANVNEFSNWCYLTQCAQSLCMKAESEYYRRGRGTPSKTMGAIYWQLNSIWQAPTWSSLEYGGRWKVLHYHVKKFFSPVLVSSYEFPPEQYNVWVVSDSVHPLKGEIRFGLWSWKGVQLTNWTLPFSLNGLESKSLMQTSTNDLMKGICKQKNQCFVTLSCVDNSGEVLSTNEFYLSELSEVDLFSPNISIVSVESVSDVEAKVVLSSTFPAPYTFLSTSIDGHFSDNAFLLLPGKTEVTFVSRKNFQIADFKKSLKVMSLKDTYEKQ